MLRKGEVEQEEYLWSNYIKWVLKGGGEVGQLQLKLEAHYASLTVWHVNSRETKGNEVEGKCLVDQATQIES